MFLIQLSPQSTAIREMFLERMQSLCKHSDSCAFSQGFHNAKILTHLEASSSKVSSGHGSEVATTARKVHHTDKEAPEHVIKVDGAKYNEHQHSGSGKDIEAPSYMRGGKPVRSRKLERGIRKEQLKTSTGWAVGQQKQN